ncbi:hypothetical protein OIV75_003390 [Acinetobacter baumannii]|uniref:hypothetical protein n=2 Tax=Acinetobacter baumannii TaxID=470 RepID=UPI001D0D786D|nr:hypothetical protein [Acinetobacter baumannii]
MQRVIISLLGVLHGLGVLAIGFITAFIFAVLAHLIVKAKTKVQVVALDITMFTAASFIVLRIDQELRYNGDLFDLHVLVFASVAFLYFINRWIKK